MCQTLFSVFYKTDFTLRKLRQRGETIPKVMQLTVIEPNTDPRILNWDMHGRGTWGRVQFSVPCPSECHSSYLVL